MAAVFTVFIPITNSAWSLNVVKTTEEVCDSEVSTISVSEYIQVCNECGSFNHLHLTGVLKAPSCVYTKFLFWSVMVQITCTHFLRVCGYFFIHVHCLVTKDFPYRDDRQGTATNGDRLCVFSPAPLIHCFVYIILQSSLHLRGLSLFCRVIVSLCTFSLHIYSGFFCSFC